MSATIAPYTVVLPARLSAQGRQVRPATQVYVRRRLLVVFVLVAIVVALVAGAGNVLANRGGAPASTSAVRPAQTYVARSGDTMWSIALAHRGAASQADYVDALIAVNGGVAVQVGEVITLP
jgi:Tfp pilus assembly protein FimV